MKDLLHRSKKHCQQLCIIAFWKEFTPLVTNSTHAKSCIDLKALTMKTKTIYLHYFASNEPNWTLAWCENLSRFHRLNFQQHICATRMDQCAKKSKGNGFVRSMLLFDVLPEKHLENLDIHLEKWRENIRIKYGLWEPSDNTNTAGLTASLLSIKRLQAMQYEVAADCFINSSGGICQQDCF